MAQIIRLNDETYVASDEISEIKVNSHRTHLDVTMKNGNRHSIEGEYGGNIWRQADELMAKVNEANG